MPHSGCKGAETVGLLQADKTVCSGWGVGTSLPTVATAAGLRLPHVRPCETRTEPGNLVSARFRLHHLVPDVVSFNSVMAACDHGQQWAFISASRAFHDQLTVDKRSRCIFADLFFRRCLGLGSVAFWTASRP